MKLLALDPATHYTGYALWDEGPIVTKVNTFTPVQAGVIRVSHEDWDMRCLEMNSKIRNFIVNLDIEYLIAEFPQFQAGNRGMNAARGGDTLKLAYLCGSIACGWQLHQAERMKRSKELIPMLRWVTPSQWKGQLPKDITAQRCFQRYGFQATTEIERNISDAIMIGHYWLDKSPHSEGKGEFKRVDL